MKEMGARISRDKLLDVWGDSTLITELYQNLIGNALKFSGDQRPIIRLTFGERDGEQIFGVKDNDIGIEPKYAEEIFKPFRRLHGRAEYEGRASDWPSVVRSSSGIGGRSGWILNQEKGLTSSSRFPIEGGNGLALERRHIRNE